MAAFGQCDASAGIVFSCKSLLIPQSGARRGPTWPSAAVPGSFNPIGFYVITRGDGSERGATAQRRAFPAALVEVKHPAGLGGEVGSRGKIQLR